MGILYIEGEITVTAEAGEGEYNVPGKGASYTGVGYAEFGIDSILKKWHAWYVFTSNGSGGGGGGGARASAIIGGGGAGGGAGGSGLSGSYVVAVDESTGDGRYQNFTVDTQRTDGADGTASQGGTGGASNQPQLGEYYTTGGTGGTFGKNGNGGTLYIATDATVNGVSGSSLSSQDLLGADGEDGGNPATVKPLTRLNLYVNLDDDGYADREVFLWNETFRDIEMKEDSSGCFFAYVPKDDSEVYHIYIDGKDTDYTFIPANDVEYETIDFYTCTVETTLDGEAYEGRRVQLLRAGIIIDVMGKTGSDGKVSKIYMKDVKGTDYDTFDVYVDGVDSGKDLTVKIDASEIVPFCTVAVDVKLDDAPYSDQEVSLIRNGEFVTQLKGMDTAGRYGTVVLADGTNYGVTIGTDVSSKSIKAAAGETVPTVNYYSAEITLTNDDTNWTGQTVTLTGGGKVKNAEEDGTRGVYKAILFEEDETEYTAVVNGVISTKTVKITERSSGRDKATVYFFKATVNLTKNGEAWTDGANVVLKQNGKTVYVLSAEGSSFVKEGVAEGTYYIYVYGTASDSDTRKIVVKDNTVVTDDYFSVDFIKNLCIPGGADDTNTVYKTQIVRSGDTPSLASSPYQAGYTFLGWKTEADYSSASYEPSPVTAYTRVYASWSSPSVTLGRYVRCDHSGTAAQDGAYFNTPNLAIQGYPLTGNVISTIIISLTNAGLLDDSAPEGWKCTKQYDAATGSGKLIYQKDTGEKLTVKDAESFLRGIIYQVVKVDEDATLQVTTYGDTNN